MTRPFSLYLDLVRFVAALTVFVSHWAHPRFTGGAYLGIRTLNLGSDAVLFVLAMALCLAFAQVFERSLPRLRSALKPR